jgi:GTP pyrophosphokinase
VQNLLYESDRRVSVEWARPADETTARRQTYPVRLTIFCDDRTGMLKELTAVISDENANIRTVDSRSGPHDGAIVEFVVDAEDVRHLTRLVQGLRRVPGVRDVQRSPKL